MYGVLFLCLITTRNAFAQIVTWTVGTAVPRYTESLNLTCTVSADCCTSAFRVWQNAAGVQILSDGVSSDPNKYEEDWNGGTTGFNLIIKNLALTDVETDYNCQYKLGNDKHTLTQTATWEYRPTESCPYSYVPFGGLADSTFAVSRSAPSPSITASFEGKNLTSGLTITGPTNFDIWFYSFKVSIDTDLLCQGKKDAELKVKVVTGTSTTDICEYKYLCYPCWECAVLCFAWALLGTFAGCTLTWFCCLICFCCYDSWTTKNYFGIKFEVKTDENCSVLYGKSYSKVNRNRALLISIVATISGCIVITCLIYAFFLYGSNCPNCKGKTEVAALVFGLGAFIFFVSFYIALNIFDDEDTCNLQQFLFFAGLELLSFLIFPMIFMIIIFCFWKKGDHTRTWQNILRNFCKVVGVIGMFILFPIIFLIIYFNHKKGRR